jgi:hypothetical protein
MYLMPSGVAGLVRRVRQRLAAKRVVAPASQAARDDDLQLPISGKEAR